MIVPYDGEDAVYLRETISPGSHQIDVWAIGAGCWTWSEEERRDSEDLGPGSSNIPVLETCLEGDYAMGERIGESTTKRREMGGKKQYGAVIRNADGSSASETEFSDWFTDDDAARVGFVGILREQGYEVASVEIGFPCVVTLK